MEIIGRCGKTTDADMAAYVKEENKAQLNEQAEQEWEDGDFDDEEINEGRTPVVDSEIIITPRGEKQIAQRLEEDHPPFCDKPPNGAEIFWACVKAEQACLMCNGSGRVD